MLSKELIQREVVRIQVSDLQTPDRLTIQIMEGYPVQQLAHLLCDLHAYQPGPQLHEPWVHELICAKYEGAWYRGQVLRIDNRQSIAVHFIDYGNVEIIMNRNEVGKITKQLAHYPILGIVCCLANVGGVANQAGWMNWVTHVLPHLGQIYMNIVSKIETGYQVELLHSDSPMSALTINQELVEQGILQQARNTCLQHQMSQLALETPKLPRLIGVPKCQIEWWTTQWRLCSQNN
jgi:hypothetical protein